MLDFGKYGVKMLAGASKAAGLKESMAALETFSAKSSLQRIGTRSDIPTATSISKSELNIRVDDGMQYVVHQKGTSWIYPETWDF